MLNMDPREFLSIAESILDLNKPSAEECRTAISRSYYAAFNDAQALLTELRIPLEKATSSHNEVLDIIVESRNPTLKRVCDSLVARKKKRVDADYRMEAIDVETTQVAGRELCLARGLITQIDNVLKDQPAWSMASANIRAYARDVLRKTI
jgi:uncharacterized protein (UPF0332 family)